MDRIIHLQKKAAMDMRGPFSVTQQMLFSLPIDNAHFQAKQKSI